jgi:hypothetical protein
MIIGLSGYAQSGKDTVAQILISEFGFTRVAFADKIRELLVQIDPLIDGTGKRVSDVVEAFGWEDAKRFHEVRRLLQDLGVGARNVFGKNFWVAIATKDLDPHTDYVFTDVRFTNEANILKELGGHIWRVHRPGYEAVNGHVSEHELNEWNFDEMVYNAGSLDDLSDVVRATMDFRGSVS